MKYQLLIHFTLLTLVGFSQNQISGNVVNETSGEMMSKASIFISNSSIGTISNADGSFMLANIPDGQHDLIITSVGFETQVFSFNSKELPLKLRVQMRVKVKEMDAIIVEPFTEEGWDKWGSLFLKEFVGSTPNAKLCKIKNYQSIKFQYYKKSNRLTAYSDEPIDIENRALGYNIRFQLEGFEVNFGSGVSTFLGFPYFEDTKTSRAVLNKRWIAARDKAYYGSTLHFIRSLYKDSLKENGFDLQRMIRTPNFEKERIRPLYRKLIMRGSIDTAAHEKDSLTYYENIIRQKDHFDRYPGQTITADSVMVSFPEAGNKLLYFNDYLYVQYKKAKEDKNYLIHTGENREPYFQRSFIWLSREEGVLVYENGTYYPPQNMYSMGYWSWTGKLSDFLPIEFEPSK